MKTFGLFLALTLGAFTARSSNMIINGDFEAGVISPFTSVTTTNGTNGNNLPNVVSFDTTGLGASLAAHFNVGQIMSGNTSQEGGGIIQNVTTSAGTYSFFANIASQDAGLVLRNGAAGVFSILIDNVMLATQDLGSFSLSGQTIRGSISGSTDLSPGVHTFEILITRPFLTASGITPDEYVDNLFLGISSVPEPTPFALIGLGLVGFVAFKHRSVAAISARTSSAKSENL